MDGKKTALITGATSGIGEQLARCFAADGHNVVLVARSTDKLESLARELSQRHGIDATPIAKDLFEPDAARALYDEVKARGITINYLVNDAGQGAYGKFWETDLDKELGTIQLNVASLVTLTKLFLRDMVARNEGRILQLASVVSKEPAPYAAVYSGTKAFVYNFTQAVIGELEGTNVTMTALRPGATDTDFFRKAGAEDMTVVQEGKLADPAQVAKDGYAAMMRGNNKVISGTANKLMDAAANLMPDRMVARQTKKAHEPKTPREVERSLP